LSSALLGVGGSALTAPTWANPTASVPSVWPRYGEQQGRIAFVPGLRVLAGRAPYGRWQVEDGAERIGGV